MHSTSDEPVETSPRDPRTWAAIGACLVPLGWLAWFIMGLAGFIEGSWWSDAEVQFFMSAADTLVCAGFPAVAGIVFLVRRRHGHAIRRTGIVACLIIAFVAVLTLGWGTCYWAQWVID
ncbi:MAG: hypothetical protein INR66_22665 [Gordonia polyisoprenivorans]|nr:hypothetical protein [Gordonia polyisoprenivorans]